MKKPTFSVIVPTYNREDLLSKCLDSLSCLEYLPDDFEVIVVNDGGRKKLNELIDTYKSKIDVSVIDIVNSGPAHARNKGAEVARGEFLAFTDDDCEVDTNWLIAYEEKLRNHPSSLIGGKTINKLTDNIYSISSQAIIDIVYKHYNKDPDNASFFASNNIALSKQIFEEIGGFDKAFITAEDRDLCRRWKDKGLNVRYNKNAIIYHSHNLSFLTYCKQHFSYGRGSYLYYRKSKQNNLYYFSNLIRLNFNPRNLFIYPFAVYHSPLGYSIIPLLILWQVVNAAGFIFELFNLRHKMLGNQNQHQPN